MFISLEDFPLLDQEGEDEARNPPTTNSRRKDTNREGYSTSHGTDTRAFTSSSSSPWTSRSNVMNDSKISLLPDEQREVEMQRILQRRRERRESESGVAMSGTEDIRDTNSRPRYDLPSTISKSKVPEPAISIRTERRKFESPAHQGGSNHQTEKPVGNDAARSSAYRRQADFSTPSRISATPSTPSYPLRATTTSHSVTRAASPQRATELWNKMIAARSHLG